MPFPSRNPTQAEVNIPSCHISRLSLKMIAFFLLSFLDLLLSFKEKPPKTSEKITPSPLFLSEWPSRLRRPQPIQRQNCHTVVGRRSKSNKNYMKLSQTFRNSSNLFFWALFVGSQVRQTHTLPQNLEKKTGKHLLCKHKDTSRNCYFNVNFRYSLASASASASASPAGAVVVVNSSGGPSSSSQTQQKPSQQT